VNDLMLTPGISLIDFAQAEAYSRTFRFLSVVTLPRGLINLDKDIPNHDYRLLAPAAALVARSDLHPALIDLFVAAAQTINSRGQDFERPGEFPSGLHLDFPQSSEAARVLANGPSLLRRYLPFWAAVLVERTWILILPLLTLTIPLLRFAPPAYHWQIERKILKRYRELRAIEIKARAASEQGQKDVLLDQLRRLQAEADHLGLPVGILGRTLSAAPGHRIRPAHREWGGTIRCWSERRHAFSMTGISRRTTIAARFDASARKVAKSM
jgi:uncharacterized protein